MQMLNKGCYCCHQELVTMVAPYHRTVPEVNMQNFTYSLVYAIHMRHYIVTNAAHNHIENSRKKPGGLHCLLNIIYKHTAKL
jgi:hypothetical protein